MSGRLLWSLRISGIVIFALLHLSVFETIIKMNIAGLLARGPGGEELGGIYRDSPEGRRNRLISEILEWPVVKPMNMVRSRLSHGTVQSRPWRLIEEASLYGNSLAWGMAVWVVLELLTRGLWLPFRRS